MISQLEFNGVGMKVVLLFEIGLLVFPNIMVNHRDRHNERNVMGAIMIDQLQ